jgi:hypothetical protein
MGTGTSGPSERMTGRVQSSRLGGATIDFADGTQGTYVNSLLEKADPTDADMTEVIEKGDKVRHFQRDARVGVVTFVTDGRVRFNSGGCGEGTIDCPIDDVALVEKAPKPDAELASLVADRDHHQGAAERWRIKAGELRDYRDCLQRENAELRGEIGAALLFLDGDMRENAIAVLERVRLQ